MMLKKQLWIYIFAVVFFQLFLGCSERTSQEKIEKYAPRKMEQEESVTFPELGILKIKAVSIEDQLPKLIIRDLTKKVLFQLERGHSDPESYREISAIEFQVRHIPGLPEPLLMLAAVGGSGSSGRLEVALIGAVSGELKLLWNKAAYSDGGFFVGDLGKKRGVGFAQWLWKSSECHACEPDRYYVKLYIWNKEKAQFDVGPKFIIKKEKFNDIEKLGLDFPNQKEEFFR